MKRVLFGAGIALLAHVSALANVVGGVSIAGNILVANGGEVKVHFLGGDAGYDSTISLSSPSYSGEFFPNHATAVGSVQSLGTFSAGTELVFRLYVVNTGNNWYTGPGTRNPDGLVHAGTGNWVADGTIGVNGTYVGFEDLFGGGDRDYNDHQFVFENASMSVPEPSTYALMLAALGALGAGLRKRRSQV